MHFLGERLKNKYGNQRARAIILTCRVLRLGKNARSHTRPILGQEQPRIGYALQLGSCFGPLIKQANGTARCRDVAVPEQQFGSRDIDQPTLPGIFRLVCMAHGGGKEIPC